MTLCSHKIVTFSTKRKNNSGFFPDKKHPAGRFAVIPARSVRMQDQCAETGSER
ncbi:hypothetical protein [Morganella morganii IS15]|nr:hypothetical protein CSB69_2169 [Morganella morganii]EMP50330.1 hypothetical protein C790_02210 [Morganella morganii SC01]CDK66459.1 hypothetical protein [Morganella morganii IS15]